jgi:hypothetical protein
MRFEGKKHQQQKSVNLKKEELKSPMPFSGMTWGMGY